MKTKPWLSLVHSLIILLFFISCKKTPVETSSSISKVTGYVQKGPFISGSTITLSELTENLAQTGRTFNTQTINNKGAFNFDALNLTSPYSLLKADGFFYDEVNGMITFAPITLYALTDILDSTNVNINLLTNLEKGRIEYLIKNGLTASFSDAKKQAQKEVLAIFHITQADILPSQSLNIAEAGRDNGILLAVSSILQASGWAGQLTELLSSISEDIKEDGVLNNNSLYMALLNGAALLDTAKVKENLERRYSDIGATSNTPVFGKYIDTFLRRTALMTTGSEFIYPEWGIYTNRNILSSIDSVFSYRNNSHFSVCARILDTSINRFKVRITELSTNPNTEHWHMEYSSNATGGRIFPENNSINYSFTLTQFDRVGLLNGGILDIEVQPGEEFRFLVEYFENDFLTPIRNKIIKVVY